MTRGAVSGLAGLKVRSSKVAAVLTSACVFLASLFNFIASAHAEEPIFCGQPLQRHLAAGEVDAYDFSAQLGTAVFFEAIDDSQDTPPPIGPIRLTLTTTTPPQDTCFGTLIFGSAGGGIVEASDCMGNGSGDYTITYAVVSEGPDNCGIPLPCRQSLGGMLSVPGAVQPYTFPGIQGDHVTLTLNNLTPASISTLRLRIYDPTGKQVNNTATECSGSANVTLPSTGTYTAVVSTCSGPQTGRYSITWQPPTCQAAAQQGQFAYVTNSDAGNVSVIDLATNTTRAIIPIAPPGREEIGAPIAIDITPNGGFAYVAYGNSTTVAVINTSTNLVVASVPVGLDATDLAISPDGASVYVLANDLGGIAVIDTKTNQMRDFLRLDIGFSDSIALSPDGAFAYVVSEDQQGLFVINLSERAIKGFVHIALGIFNDPVKVSPDGQLVYVGSGNGIVVINAATNTAITPIAVNEPFDIAFAPDGRTAYASIPDDSVLAVIDTANSQVTTTITVGVDTAGVAVSPDGALVYVTDFTAGETDPGFNVVATARNKVIALSSTLSQGSQALALTSSPSGLCVGDTQGQTQVTIDEIIKSVDYALNGCPGRFPAMDTLVP